ncbi:histone deacetylase complex subunit SAP30L-like [Oscarella lobularis]|uniref:histone deacetylase complex subunit SAP30L-like n=1 Tax=Oscarella lobularis TaxID=121494 RepID=UPI003313556F
MLQSNGRPKRRRKDSEDDQPSDPHDVRTRNAIHAIDRRAHRSPSRQIDLGQLQVNTLRRYKRHFKLQTRPGLNKAQLVEVIWRHFRCIPVTEKEVLTYFIYMAKTHKSKFDQAHAGKMHGSP